MSEESRIQIEQTDERQEYVWPPTEDQIIDIASSALNQSHDKNVKVLVYWENPTIMILEPFHIPTKDYIRKKFEYHERTVIVIIGKQDKKFNYIK